MKQLFSLLFFFVFLSGFAFAQDISGSHKPATTPFGQGTLLDVPAVTITHSVSDTIIAGSVACNAGGIHTDNSYYRAFTLADFGITQDFNVTMVEIGIEQANGGGGTQPITVNLWTSSQPFPNGFPGSLTQIGTANINVPDQALTLFQIPVTGTAPAGSELVVEIFTPDGTAGGNSFFIGSNSLGQTGPSYILAAACGITVPTDLAAIGFPNMHIVMSVTGDVSSGYGLPELLYYIFDENTGTTTANYAVPGVGTNPAPLSGTTTWATPGQFGSAIIGDGVANGGIVTGYNWDRGAGDWTISMWLEIPTNSSGSAYYIFGDGGSTSFRCFHNGVALPDNLVMRGGGMSDCLVTGIGPAPTVVTYVYNSAVPEVVAYKNGVLFANFPQPALNMPVGTGFKCGGYGASATMIGKMDEFRVYNRALDAAEVAATWNISIIPVELTSFTASVTGNDVKLLWETATETNNSGFSIERKSANSQYLEVGFVPGFGTTSEPKSYSFNDQNLRTGEYTYRLKQIDFDGTFTYSDEVSVDIIAPAEFSLDQNYPNPFNPSTKITFSLAADSKVSLKVFDVIGQEVASLINQDLSAGVHNYTFNATGINSGVYFYRIEATGVNGTEFVDVKKMILVK